MLCKRRIDIFLLFLCTLYVLAMKKYALYIVLLLSFFSCSDKKSVEQGRDAVDTIPMLVMQIQKCSKLYTAEYHVRKIVTHDDQVKLNGTFLRKDFSVDLPLGSRKIAIPLDVTLKAYIDFSHFNKSRVVKRGHKIEIILPDPKVALTSSRIDHDGVKQHVAFTRSRFTDAELTSYERQGRDAVIREIPRMGIVEMARENAARVLIPMLVQMGYDEKDITISFRKDLDMNDIWKLIDRTTVEKDERNVQ